jgi:hypothetical protein
MSKKYRAKPEEVTDPYALNRLPLDRPIAVYYRQSSDSQIGNVSTAMQQVDLPNYLAGLGWQRDKITLFDEDGGVSGTKAIDERTGLSKIYDLVMDGKIGAVACVSVDRLFRDRYGIEPGKFAKACQEHEVMVLVPNDDPYVFHHPARGDRHVDRFLEDCKDAADELYKRISKRMHGAQKRLRNLGLWTGGNITSGFMVNAATNKYEPLPSVWEVVLEYFRLLTVVYRGNVSATAKHIAGQGPYFPDWNELEPRDGYIIRKPNRIEKRNGHYYPNVPALRTMFTNVAYIGHWSINGVILQLDNHPSIVPLPMFMAAFNYLSPVTFTGEPNPDYCPRVTRAKDTDTENREKAVKPWLEGFLYSPDENGKMRPMLVAWEKERTHEKKPGGYQYLAISWNDKSLRKLWRKDSWLIDRVVLDCVKIKLAQSDFKAELETAIQTDYGAEHRRLSDLIRKTEQQTSNLIERLTEVDDPDPGFAKLMHDKYKALVDEKQRLEHKMNDLMEAADRQEELTNLRQYASYWFEHWGGLTADQRRLAITLCVKQIYAVPDGEDMELVIYWNDNTDSRHIIPRNGGKGWTNVQNDRLIELVANGADQETVAAEFPKRKWKHIKAKYRRLSGGVNLHMNPHPVHDLETFEDYQWRTAEYGEDHADTLDGISDDSQSTTICRRKSRMLFISPALRTSSRSPAPI